MTLEILETVHSNIRQNIDNPDVGFAVMCISQTERDEPRFFYTIGLTEQGLPELFLSGNFNPETVGMLFNDTVSKWQERGVKLGEDGDIAQNKHGETMRTKFVGLDTLHLSLQKEYAVQLFEHYFVHYPNKLSKNAEINVVQMIWPDKDNHLPLEEGYDKTMQQTLLPVRGLH